MGKAAQGLFMILGIAFIAIQAGIFIPVDKAHCIEGEPASVESIDVESGWQWTGLRLFPWTDSDTCVYNTPTREALSALGIWPLDSPEDQVEDHVRSRIERGY